MLKSYSLRSQVKKDTTSRKRDAPDADPDTKAIHKDKKQLLTCFPISINGQKKRRICRRASIPRALLPSAPADDVEKYLLDEPALSDLHISIAASACNMHGSYSPFTPFPDNVVAHDPNNSMQYKFSKDQLHYLHEMIQKIPSIDTLTSWIKEGQLKSNCDKIHPLVCPLLRWIISSNSHNTMKHLSKEERFQSITTDNQYAILHNSQREEKFQEMRKEYGSRYAWHGTAASSMHSILREGLKVMSGTSGQVHGAVSGSGCYLAQYSSCSSQYIQYASSWNNSQKLNGPMGSLVLCEIIEEPRYAKQSVYVIPIAERIQVRFFFLFVDSHVGIGNVDASKFPAEIPDIKGYKK